MRGGHGGRRKDRQTQPDLVDIRRARRFLGVVDLVGDGAVHAAGRLRHRAAGKFYLVAVPTLVGAAMRIPYTVAPAKFGGRNWTIVSALLLLIPTVLTLWVMNRPDTSYTMFMIVAAFAGSAAATSRRR